MKTFYEKDADVNLIKNKKVAIFGYGKPRTRSCT